jgi:hypothetical protein
VIENLLGFCALVLMMLMLLSLAVWFCCSVVEHIRKMRRQRKKYVTYAALLRENQRLKDLVAVVVKENPHLRARLQRIYESERAHRERSVRQPAA